MNQLTQQLKSGKMEILEVPFPALGAKQVLVRNHYSVISAGTEGKTVTDARKGYIAKARSRQKEVKQVIEMVKANGLLSTYKLVMNKLEAPAALGYSTAGEIIAIGAQVTNFKVGDRVACGGATASHADVVAVPINLCTKVPEGIHLKEAAFSTIAAIALQGIRQADVQVGQRCVIIGLGLIGILTAQILQASGVKVLGVDINDQQINLAKNTGFVNTFNRNQAGIEEIIAQFTNGHGADSVLITAGTSSLDPVNFAGTIARKKAKVVIVGAVPTGFDRKDYYRKELDLRMSSSYGPGRYDSNYEEKGIDYPIGYVRFTEQRNMETYLDLLAAQQLNIDQLITHTFPLQQAPEAYQMIVEKSDSFLGICIEYDTQNSIEQRVTLHEAATTPTSFKVGFIGAGAFSQNLLLPNLREHTEFSGVVTARGNNARYVADKYNFAFCTNNVSEVLSDSSTGAVFITTRHNLHAQYILEALSAGKHVFVEKPLAMTPQELDSIRDKKAEHPNQHLIVGFNRRFAPAVQAINKLFLPEQSKSILIRVNAGILPADHWVNDPEVGGGRIIGEACHFIDLAQFLAQSPITTVSAQSMDDANGLANTININLSFQNGSIASVSYFSNGHKKVAKEYIEVFCGGTVAQVNDFQKLTVTGNRSFVKKWKGQDKGHASELAAFIQSIKQGQLPIIPFTESYLSTSATFAAIESAKSGRTITINT